MQKQTTALREIRSSFESLEELTSLADSSNDAEMYEELLPEILSLKKQAAELTKALLLSEPADANGAYIEIKSGSGGTEACDWAGILARMYARWAQSHDFSGPSILGSSLHIPNSLTRISSALIHSQSH